MLRVFGIGGGLASSLDADGSPASAVEGHERPASSYKPRLSWRVELSLDMTADPEPPRARGLHKQRTKAKSVRRNSDKSAREVPGVSTFLFFAIFGYVFCPIYAKEPNMFVRRWVDVRGQGERGTSFRNPWIPSTLRSTAPLSSQLSHTIFHTRTLHA